MEPRHLGTIKRGSLSFLKTLLADLGTVQNGLHKHVLRVPELAFLPIWAPLRSSARWPLGVQLTAMRISMICLDLPLSLSACACAATRTRSLTDLERKRPLGDAQTLVLVTFKKCPSWRLDFSNGPSQACFANSSACHPCQQRTTPQTR